VRHEPPEAIKAVRARVPEVLAKNYKIDMKELAALYNSQPWLRSAPAQRMMLDAARYQLAQEAVANSRQQSRPIPNLAKPGVSEPRLRGEDGRYASLSAEFKSNPTAQAGAALIAARRANRSR
jgi:hypothetical protein